MCHSWRGGTRANRLINLQLARGSERKKVMSSWCEQFEQSDEQLKTRRDELRVQLNLGKKEAEAFEAASK
ncbi:MAG: hypothetical protein ACI9DC_002834 [Gammaproteobacteria bacterium]|jgi:hypothetical protein